MMPTMRTLNMGTDEVSAEEFYRDPPDGVRVNMVASLDGAAAFDGRVRPLSDAVDHQLLRALRTYADVVLVGAGTIRAERYGPAVLTEEQSRYRLEQWGQDAPPPIAVVTRTGNIPLDTPLFTGDVRALVITSQRTATEHGSALEEAADIVVAGGDTVEMPALSPHSGTAGSAGFCAKEVPRCSTTSSRTTSWTKCASPWHRGWPDRNPTGDRRPHPGGAADAVTPARSDPRRLPVPPIRPGSLNQSTTVKNESPSSGGAVDRAIARSRVQPPSSIAVG